MRALVCDRGKKRGKPPGRDPPPAPLAVEPLEPPAFLSEYMDDGQGAVAELEGFTPVRDLNAPHLGQINHLPGTDRSDGSSTDRSGRSDRSDRSDELDSSDRSDRSDGSSRI